MMLKPVKIIIFLFVFSANFVFSNEECDEGDRIWNIITQSQAVQPSNHWLVHNGRIIQKDIWEKQQHPAYWYIPGWKAYEEPVSHKPKTKTPPAFDPVYFEGNKTYLPFKLADNKNPMEHPPSDPPKKEYVPLKIFHWHLDAHTYDQDLVPRMERLLAKIEKQLQTEKLTPDIFAFTGTHTITGNNTKALLPGYPEKLCKILWKSRFKKEPDPQACKMIPADQAKGTLGKHNIFWRNHMLVISMLPAMPLIFPKFGNAESCYPCGKNDLPISSYMSLDVQYDDYMIPIMFFSTLFESIRDFQVERESWQKCVSDLRCDAGRILRLNETMVIVSHINARHYTYRDFARQWPAWIRNMDERTEELSPAVIKLLDKHSNKEHRFSAIFTCRQTKRGKKQPARAHMAPEDIYLEPPGTLQRYLEWDGYSSLRPSYTVIKLDKAGLTRTHSGDH